MAFEGRRDWILVAVWALLLFGTFFFWPKPDVAGARQIPYWAALASSLTLVVLGWSGASDTPDGAHRETRRLFAIGMSFGFAGDLCMAGGIVLLAMLTFGIGHLFYIQGVLRLGPVAKSAVAAWLVAGIAIWYGVAWGSERGPQQLVWPSLIYCILLAAMAGFGTGLSVNLRSAWPIALGGAAFLVSDATIAARMFKPTLLEHLPEALRADFVWLTYGPAQFCIMLGARMATRGEGNIKSG